jgi:chromosome segregation ATPase
MKTLNIKNQIFSFAAALGLTLAFSAKQAQAENYSAQQGLDKIKSNLENSKANQKEYERNLDIVNKNIGEVSKAKSSVLKQKDSVSGEIVKNNESLKKVLVQERDINFLIAQEQEKKVAEQKQIEQLEKLLQQLKQNQVQRDAILADYQNQLKSNSEEKKAWKDREGELRAQEAKTINSLRGLASEEATWNNKKKGYEGEAKRWSAEADKQQKIQDTYQGLANEGK